MPAKNTLKQGEELQVPSTLFNFLFVVNSSPYVLAVELTHNDLSNPILIIRAGVVESEEDKAINDKLKGYKGKEI